MINQFQMFFMKQALNLAKKAFLNNEVPVGAVIYDESRKMVIGSGFNQVENQKNTVMHAEIVALQEAVKNIDSKYLKDSIVYVTLEPCAMCLAALSSARVKRIYYGALDRKFGAIEGACNLFALVPSLYRPECYGGFLEEESAILMQSFFKQLR
ncbi:MAG: nucleoside deaminase [Rickettsiales bacterium]|nr:nucleoside deaminase [Rickettsiales bacterium]